MLRRLSLAVLALCAFFALEGCGSSRLTAPAKSNDVTIVDNHGPQVDPGQTGDSNRMGE